MEMIKIHTDGGARGNPGPAAIGVAMGAPVNKGYSAYIGKATNNEAEYSAVIFALKKLLALMGKKKTKTAHVHIFMDSELAVNQLGGQWKIEGETLIPLFVQIHNLAIDFGEISFEHVPREKNKEADALVNEALDRATGEGSLFK